MVLDIHRDALGEHVGVMDRVVIRIIASQFGDKSVFIEITLVKITAPVALHDVETGCAF